MHLTPRLRGNPARGWLLPDRHRYVPGLLQRAFATVTTAAIYRTQPATVTVIATQAMHPVGTTAEPSAALALAATAKPSAALAATAEPSAALTLATTAEPSATLTLAATAEPPTALAATAEPSTAVALAATAEPSAAVALTATAEPSATLAVAAAFVVLAAATLWHSDTPHVLLHLAPRLRRNPARG